MSKNILSSVITPKRLTLIQNPKSLLMRRERAQICIKDVVPSPRKATKLNYPFSPTRPLKTPSRDKKRDTDTIGLPSFMFDFLDEEKPQISRPSRDPINIFKIPKEKQKEKKLSKGNKSVIIETESKFPELYTQVNFELRNSKTREGRKHSADDSAYYKPYVIEITPRSSVTLYGVEPISLAVRKNSRVEKHRKNLSTVLNRRNISNEKYKRMDTEIKPVVISTPSKTFAEKLKRVQEIAKEAEKTFEIKAL
jgi:hypothetical protein